MGISGINPLFEEFKVARVRQVAEREGFEPSVELPLRILSKDVDLATLPSLQGTATLNKKHKKAKLRERKVARGKRFERLTARFVVWCSIQLS
jgi:hypothetical protein